MSQDDATDTDNDQPRSNMYYLIAGAGITTAVIGIILAIYYFAPSYIMTQVWIEGRASLEESPTIPSKVLVEDIGSGTVFVALADEGDGSYSVNVPNGRTYNVIITFWTGKILHACNAGQVTVDAASSPFTIDVQCHPIDDPLNRTDLDVSRY